MLKGVVEKFVKRIGKGIGKEGCEGRLRREVAKGSCDRRHF